MIDLVFGQPLLYNLYNLRFREEFVRSPFYVLFGKGLGTLERLV